MNGQQNFFFITFLLTLFIVWQFWKTEHHTHLENTTNTNKSLNHEILKNPIFENKSKNITIKTNVLHLKINLLGGNIEEAKLLNYSEKLGSTKPLRLLQTNKNFIYQLQSGIIGYDGPDNPKNGKPPQFTSLKKYFEIKKDQKKLYVPIFYTTNKGVLYKKIFTFKPNEYSVNIDYEVKNKSKKPIEISLFSQLKQNLDLPKDYENNSSSFSEHGFRGAAYSTNNKKYEKFKFDDIKNNKNLNIHTTNGWIAMLQQYFATALIPHTPGNNLFYSNNLGNGIIAIGFKSTPITIKPNDQSTLSTTSWIGPEIQDKMAITAKNLDLTIDYGWLWFISQPLFKLLKFINKFINNWGFSIILITFIVRGIMYPLTKAQYTSMAKMRILQPKINSIRKRVGNNNKQKISQEIMALYKTEKVNPFGGCLPLIIQMPIFLALYYMLSASIELRHAPFIFWIHDLSTQDPYYILPIFMGISMFCLQKSSPSTTTDPTQQKIMNYMPMLFTIFFLWFPSGLVLYYVVNNFVTLIQQHLIYKGLEKNGLYKKI